MVEFFKEYVLPWVLFVLLIVLIGRVMPGSGGG
jgi:hypothetical protein